MRRAHERGVEAVTARAARPASARPRCRGCCGLRRVRGRRSMSAGFHRPRDPPLGPQSPLPGSPVLLTWHTGRKYSMPRGSGSSWSCSCRHSRRSPPRRMNTIAPLAPSLCQPSRSSAARPSAKLRRRSLPGGSSVVSSTLWNMSRSTSQRESRDVARGSYLLRLVVMARTLSTNVRVHPSSSVAAAADCMNCWEAREEAVPSIRSIVDEA